MKRHVKMLVLVFVSCVLSIFLSIICTCLAYRKYQSQNDNNPKVGLKTIRGSAATDKRRARRQRPSKKTVHRFATGERVPKRYIYQVLGFLNTGHAKEF